MKLNANVGPDPVIVFRLLIDLSLVMSLIRFYIFYSNVTIFSYSYIYYLKKIKEHLKLPKSIVETMKGVLGSAIEVKDPMGNSLSICLFLSNKLRDCDVGCYF